MKSNLLKAALLVLTLTATTVQAQEFSDIDHDIVEGTIQAAMNEQKMDRALQNVVKMKMELDSIQRQIGELQDEVGQSTQNSNGVIKSLADKMLQVEGLQEDFLAADKEIQKEHGYGLALRMGEARDALNKARRVLKAAKDDVKKAYEPSEE